MKRSTSNRLVVASVIDVGLVLVPPNNECIDYVRAVALVRPGDKNGRLAIVSYWPCPASCCPVSSGPQETQLQHHEVVSSNRLGAASVVDLGGALSCTSSSTSPAARVQRAAINEITSLRIVRPALLWRALARVEWDRLYVLYFDDGVMTR